jgi:hypothetical protein
MYFVILIGALINMLYSCKEQNIDDIIDNLNTKDLSRFKGFAIHFRSGGSNWHTKIYFLSSLNLKCSPYAIEVDMFDHNDMKICNKLVLKSCNQDYLDEKTIKKMMIAYLDLRVYYIMVDNYGNIYVNPTEQTPPILFKKSSDSTLINATEFKYYRDGWCIKKKNV